MDREHPELLVGCDFELDEEVELATLGTDLIDGLPSQARRVLRPGDPQPARTGCRSLNQSADSGGSEFHLEGGPPKSPRVEMHVHRVFGQALDDSPYGITGRYFSGVAAFGHTGLPIARVPICGPKVSFDTTRVTPQAYDVVQW